MEFIPNQFKIVRARIAQLPKALRKFIAGGGTMPNLTVEEYRRRAAIARELTQATKGEITIRFSSHHYVDFDGYGHIYSGAATDERMETIHLDDRQADMQGQLAAELRRIGNEYLRLAALAEKGGVA